MTANAITLETQKDVLVLLQDSLDGKYQNDILDLKFVGWPRLEITVKGERYNGTLTTSLMKALVDFQLHLNRAYAQAIYGRGASALRQEERNALELVVEVRDGSTQIGADFGDFFTEMAKNAMEKMTGKQLATTICGIATLLIASSSFDSYLEHSQQAEEAKQQREVIERLVEQQPKLADFARAQEDVMTALVKSVSDAQEVVLNNDVKLDSNQIAEIIKPERQKSEVTRLDGEYKISLLKNRPDSYRIDILRLEDDTEFSTELFKGHLSLSEMQLITDAFLSDKPINLAVVGRIRGEAISNAHIAGILSTDNQHVAKAAIPPSLEKGLNKTK